MFFTNTWTYIVAILLLVSIHEWGHYWVAKKCGVAIEKFSIGFGAPLLSWKNKEGTVFCIAMIPLGGYVKMRGEYAITTEEGRASQSSGSFAACNVWQRMAIVAAGPLVNILFAFVVFSVLSFGSQKVVSPVAQTPAANTLASPLGIQTGDTITEINHEAVRQWNDISIGLSKAVFEQKSVELSWRTADGGTHQGQINTAGLSIEDPSWMKKTGLMPQETQPLFSRVISGSVAEMAGFEDGDEVTQVNGQPIHGASALMDAISGSPEKYLTLTVKRGNENLAIDVKPAAETIKTSKDKNAVESQQVGRIGVIIEGVNIIEIHNGALTAVKIGAKTTWDSAITTFRGMYKMLTGQLSLKNIGGPVTTAEIVGASTAAAGWAGFIGILALLSVSLGALNLLPIPMLDGGHLVYYVIEVLTGKPVSERVLAVGQRVGLAFLLALMGVAFYNDGLKLLG